MATSCANLRTTLAYQTPVFDETFLQDYISDMVNEPYVGRHMTETWEDGASVRYFDKIHVQQPDFNVPWGQRTSDGSVCSPCQPPSTFIGWGTTRDQYNMQNITLYSKKMCLDQLRQVPRVSKQIAEIYRVVRKIPLSFMGDFIRTRSVSYNDTLYIAGNAFNTLALTSMNIDPALTTINLGSDALLPTSELTWTYLNYYQQMLGLQGYDQDSGLAKGMRNLITHSRTYARLVGMNPEIKAQLHLVGVKDVSPLYELGTGINADPFGSFAPTFDEKQVRFQHAANGVLQRVFPYYNSPATTGEKPVVNPAWLNARYAISTILHPKAYSILTPKPKKIHEMVPTVNSAMWGVWDFINPKGVIMAPNPDGTFCTENNDLQWLFYWMCYLETGIQYQQRNLVVNILHLIDGSGKLCAVDSPVCGEEPQYAAQYYGVDPGICEQF
jgi:hypothetical protein